MRATIHQLIVADIPLMTKIPADRWYQQGSVVDVPTLPFAILRWISPVSGDARGTFAHQLQVAVFDNRGTYKNIEAILGGPYRTGGLYPILKGLMGVTGPDGYIAQADYLGDSGDDVNIDYRANTKFSSWQIAGRTTS